MKGRLILAVLSLATVSLALFLFRLGHPPVYLYDEKFYVDGAKSFLNGEADANPQHPPLAKYMIAGGIKLFGDNPFGWRFASAICGCLTLVALFLWSQMLLKNFALSLAVAIMSLFNNFLYVMSRVAMLDIFYFMFVMLGILAFTAAILLPELNPLRRRVLFFVSGTMFGLGGACKWNSIVTLAAVGLVALYLYVINRNHLREIGLPTVLSSLGIVPLLAYALAYLPLCIETHRPFTVHELVAMNIYIWRWHVLCPGNPMLHVPWYDWFFRAKPERAFSYLMGNFVVLWIGLVALIPCAWQVWKNRSAALPELLVVLFYVVNVLQWIVIPQKMTCYYYYYPPAMFLGLALALVLSKGKMNSIAGVRPSILIMTATFVFFLYCYPKMAELQAPYDCALGCWS